METNPEILRARLLQAVDLMEFGISLMRQNIVRRLSDASGDRVNAELNRWLIVQPENFIPGAPTDKESP